MTSDPLVPASRTTSKAVRPRPVSWFEKTTAGVESGRAPVPCPARWPPRRLPNPRNLRSMTHIQSTREPLRSRPLLPQGYGVPATEEGMVGLELGRRAARAGSQLLVQHD